MKKAMRYILFGIIFSVILVKVEAISWFRIQEMFYFESFHMYGVLFSGILVAGITLRFYEKRKNFKLEHKPLTPYANAIGGLCFGLGWGITGACSGPLYALIGLNITPAIVVLIAAIVGTLIYALLKSKLPH